MKMRVYSALAVIGMCLILAAGCTSPSGSGAATPGSTVAATATTAATDGSHGLPRNAIAILTNGTYAINASVDQIEIDRLDDGSHKVNIYLTIRNSGILPAQLRWYSTLTNADGVSYGGIGVSHGGSGAESALLSPGATGSSARDYVVITSEKDYISLSKGATLDVFFTTEPLTTDETPMTFSATWALDPAVFT